MGVDYTGHYGIGVQLKSIDFEDDSIPENMKNFDSFYEFVEDVIFEKRNEFGLFETGDCMYNGKQNDYFIYIKNPFENGIDGIHEKWNNLKHFLINNKIEYIGDLDCVGGLLID